MKSEDIYKKDTKQCETCIYIDRPLLTSMCRYCHCDKKYPYYEKKLENKTMEFINKSNLEFKSLSDEEERIYIFPNGKEFRIEKPLWFNCSSTGGHRIFAADGWSYYIQPREGWVIKWKVKEGESAFAF